MAGHGTGFTAKLNKVAGVKGFYLIAAGGFKTLPIATLANWLEHAWLQSLPLFAKIEVNGDAACDLYKHLTALETKPVGPGKISWNFEKFIISRSGEIVARFSPRTKPDDPEVLKIIAAELAKK